MSHFSPAYFHRGASVLAALVLAAFMASVALLVQMGQPGPADVSQTAAASTATTAASDSSNQQKTSTRCQNGIDVLYRSPTSEPVVQQACAPTGTGKTVTKTGDMSTYLKDQLSDESRTCEYAQDGKLTENKSWKCVTRICGQVPKSTADVMINGCSYSVSDISQETKTVAQGTGGTVSNAAELDKLAQAAAQGDSGAANELKNKYLTGDSATQRAIEDAYTQQAEEAAQQYNAADDTVQRLQYLNAVCGSGSGTQTGCDDLKAAQDARTQAEKQLQNITNQYEILQANQKALSAGGCEPGAPGCYNVPTPPVQQNGQVPAGSNPYNGQGNTFGGQPSAAQQAAQRAAQQQAAQRAAQQQAAQQSQQQCQPRYVCNGNSVTYLPCANLNQNGAQTIQQCPTGYACKNGSYEGSNSSCQPQAIYGYCSDGRTPRTGPAQTQPPASTCTVGTWQDTSNGCQTGWQCIAGNATTTGSQPTAQLSCQPLAATNGTVINFSYACAGGSTAASASNFTIATSSLSGTATTTAVRPSGTNTVTYGLTCTNAAVSPNLTATAQCQVQVGATSIVMVALPEKITKTETDETKRKATIGWVTTGMQSCSILSSLFADWTSQQAYNTSVNGAAVSPVLTDDTTFLLTCQTIGGITATSSVTVLAI